MIMTEGQLLACRADGMSAAETARQFGVTRSAISWRAKKLNIRFTNKRGQGKRREWHTCLSCKHRKLCLLCHRLHVAALPCEKDLLFSGHSEPDPYIWPRYYLKLQRSLAKFATL